MIRSFLLGLLFAALVDGSLGSESARDEVIEWVKSRSDPGTWRWGEQTPRVATALLLVGGLTEDHDVSVIKANLRVHFMNLFKDSSRSNLLAKTAALVGMLAACEPVERTTEVDYILKTDFSEPYQQLARCILGTEVPIRLIEPTDNGNKDFADRLALWIMLLKCVEPQGLDVRVLLERAYRNAEILFEKNDLSVYSTAHFAQAFILSEEDEHRKVRQSLVEKLTEFQARGALKDLYGTYLALPALAGTSLVDLARNPCKIFVPQSSPQLHYIRMKTPSDDFVVKLMAPSRVLLLDLLNKASNLVTNYKFETITVNNVTSILKMNSLPNDAERNLYWRVATYNPRPPVVPEQIYLDVKVGPQDLAAAAAGIFTQLHYA